MATLVAHAKALLVLLSAMRQVTKALLTFMRACQVRAKQIDLCARL
jgi:hypothetical protein